MKKVETLILERSDLIGRGDKEFLEINITDFKGVMTPLVEAPLVIFIDNDMKTKILKNRFGYDGIVFSERERKLQIESISEKLKEFASSLTL